MWLFGELLHPEEQGAWVVGLLALRAPPTAESRVAGCGAPATSTACSSWQAAWARKELHNLPGCLESQQDRGWALFW